MMAKGKKNFLVLGKFKIRLPDRVARWILGAGSEIKERAKPLVRHKVRIGRANVPIVFFLVAILAILPIGMAFGEGEIRNLRDPEELITIDSVNFYRGPVDDKSNPVLPGQFVAEGKFWLEFTWSMKGEVPGEPNATLKDGDWFEVTFNLGTHVFPATVMPQGNYAPIIRMLVGEALKDVGTITWMSAATYKNDGKIVLRLKFGPPPSQYTLGDGLTAGEDPNDPTKVIRVNGTGKWGFEYKPEGKEDDEVDVYWEFEGHDPFPVIPIPPPIGTNDKWNPYEKNAPGFSKRGARLTPSSTPFEDSIYYWNVLVNRHKHSDPADWNSCPSNSGDPRYVNCPCPKPFNDSGNLVTTLTIKDDFVGMVPTALRNVTKTSGSPSVGTATLPIGQGLYGKTKGAASGPAFLKLFYINSLTIWNQLINYQNSGYGIPGNDSTHIKGDHPVGPYDPLYTHGVLEVAEFNSVLYWPNYTSPGEYTGFLTPVPPEDISAIRFYDDDSGFEIDIVMEKLRGKTLSIGYMTQPTTNDDGDYPQFIGNGVKFANTIPGATINEEINLSIGGNVTGSNNKGKFVLEKYEYNSPQPKMSNVAFSIIATGGDQAARNEVTATIAAMTSYRNPGDATNVLRTQTGGADNGKISFWLPRSLPVWTQDLELTILELAAPEGFKGVSSFKVIIDKTTRKVKTITPSVAADAEFIIKLADGFGVKVYNRDEDRDESFYDAALRKYVTRIERTIDGKTYVVFDSEAHHGTRPSVRNGDKVLYYIEVFNQCYNDIQIPEVMDWMTPGLRFDPAATMANRDPSKPAYNNNQWEIWNGWADDGILKTAVKYIGPPMPIELPKRSAENNYAYTSYKIPLVLIVDLPENLQNVDKNVRLVNIAEISAPIKDKDGKEVEDKDSTPDRDPYNDGKVDPCIEYPDDWPHNGKVTENEIEGDRKKNGNQVDEDDHDFACIVVRKAITCEVDKDTIRRTSAAFDGSAVDVKIGGSVVNNVGVENYRYDIDFRSTASMRCDEFVVTDPLENVGYDQVRVLGLWTPAVWGDADGRMNVWYKTKNGSGKSETVPTGAARITKVDNPRFPVNASGGWKLWRTIDQSASTAFMSNGLITRVRLHTSELGLAAGDYITALCFEYGAVKVGFTSKNYADVSINGEHRGPNGELTLPPEALDRLKNRGAVRTLEATEATPLTIENADEPASGNIFTRLISALTGGNSDDTEAAGAGNQDENALEAQQASASIAALAGAFDDQATPPPTGIVDWTPSPTDSFFPTDPADVVQLTSLATTAGASPLKPASYLVECVRAMENELIVSSAVAQAAAGSLTDEDVDAVLTREIVTFTLNEEEPGHTLLSDYKDNIPAQPPKSEETRGGQSARTFDEMNPVFWIGMAALALTAAGLVFLLWLRHKRRTIAEARAGGRRRSR